MSSKAGRRNDAGVKAGKQFVYASLRGRYGKSKQKRKENNYMSDLILKEINLPNTIENLAKFVLFNREKIIAIRAEIRAIDKLELAQDVRKQKMEEASMLSEAILDAEIKLGELFRQMPKAANQYKSAANNGVKSKSKKEALGDLGFSQMQASRLETLSDNPDLVEQVKAEARENGELPTRTHVLELAANQLSQDNGIEDASIEPRILDMADYGNKHESDVEEYDNFINTSVKTYREFMKMIDVVEKFDMSEYRMDALRENFDRTLRVDAHIRYIEMAKDKLTMLEVELRKPLKHRFSYR